jgi:hypothetical protein
MQIKNRLEMPMSDQEIYQKFVEWLGKTWWGLPGSDHLMPLIKTRYTVEEAAFLTGILQGMRSMCQTLPDGCDSVEVLG